ncbi:unnamed protein product [Vicia faba]|uniref:Reverse transcriptase domain-containing protein n=1 Tax=Vicia faba TaxID=3906 RepID=A0AAV1AKY9_VICFA|nr:unnamed protein product [Vicia faba]
MANFKFKVITKILADMLASMMLELISLEQMGFIQGTQIKDCSCLASEVENSLHNKSFAGNIALKIDVTNTLTHLNGLSFSRFLGLLVLVKFFAIELRLFLDLQHCLSLSMDPCMAISNALEGILRARVLRGIRCINHLIPSTIWSGIKNEFHVVKENSTTPIGNVHKTNFWLDHWCGTTCLDDTFNIPAAWRASLNDMVLSYIHNHHWNIPH